MDVVDQSDNRMTITVMNRVVEELAWSYQHLIDKNDPMLLERMMSSIPLTSDMAQVIYRRVPSARVVAFLISEKLLPDDETLIHFLIDLINNGSTLFETAMKFNVPMDIEVGLSTIGIIKFPQSVKDLIRQYGYEYHRASDEIVVVRSR